MKINDPIVSKTTSTFAIAYDGAAFAGRVLLVAIFIIEAWSKLNGYSAATAYMAKFGVPGFLLPFAILTELGCGLLIAVGWQTRLAALALAIFCAATGLIFHTNLNDKNQSLHLLKDISIAGGFLMLVAHGAGGWSVDARTLRRR